MQSINFTAAKDKLVCVLDGKASVIFTFWLQRICWQWQRDAVLTIASVALFLRRNDVLLHFAASHEELTVSGAKGELDVWDIADEPRR